MDLYKRIKIASVLVIVLIVGYALYNHFFYEPPIKTPIINNPIIVPDPTDEEPIEEPFDGIYVDLMPIVDESDRVRLYMSEDELFQSPFVAYEWKEINLPVYEKVHLTLEEIDSKVEALFTQLDIDTSNKVCDDFNQDGLELTTCEFEDGYLEVVQDGSYYIIFHGDSIVPLESFEISDIKLAIQTSWLSTIVDVDTMDVVIENYSYDTYGEKVYEVVIVNNNDEFGYHEKFKLMISYENLSISGISKNADQGKEIKQYAILSPSQVDENIKLGLYYSTMVDNVMFEGVTILGYGLTYDTSMFSNVIIPVVEVYVTSADPTFTDCFDVEGIVIHPLKVIAINQENLRAR